MVLSPERRTGNRPSFDPLAGRRIHLHFIGIGGIGMSGLALVFRNQGYEVSGSDLRASETTELLTRSGIKVFTGHAPEHVGDATVVVVSSAVQGTNPEVVEAHKRKVPVVKRAEILGELMRGRHGIAVAGTHGKTTSTSMIGLIVQAAGWDPTVVVGGRVDGFGGNAKLGAGTWVVAEADESDGSFLQLPATYALITNIDNDHLDYFHTLEALEKAFVDFEGKLPFYGCAVVCGDDPGVARVQSSFAKPFLCYGFNESNDFYARDVVLKNFGSTFQVVERTREGQLIERGEVRVGVPGRHNALNALGAVTLALQLGISIETCSMALGAFTGVRRRFEIKWRSADGRKLMVDDYGHHPTEIRATLAAARENWSGRIVTVFQPHRFSRTKICWDAFLGCFRETDVLLGMDIYPAGEAPVEGVSTDRLLDGMRTVPQRKPEVLYTPLPADVRGWIEKESRPGDLLLFSGAGSISQLATEIAADWKKRESH